MSNARLFVASRGEIALRAIRAAHQLGMTAVLGASMADLEGLTAREADRTVVLGPPAPRASYLKPDLVVHAALATGCTALHPGYGFLSERPELAELCVAEGISFIGPTAESIRAVGDKLSARRLAEAAGVPVTRGSGRLRDLEHALQMAEALGYPVITKASAGGGGRGMSVARDASELADVYPRAAATARESFGDDTIYLESFVERARHVEVQVVGDGNGRVVHFGERDCSIQRRHQKMIEEAPAVILPQPIQQRLHEAALALLGSIAYRNAGTVEFLYDEDRQAFSFMEVNARIQVEHPVSEAICGVDLVRLQLGIGTGSSMLPRQTDVMPRGHAIEVRILAEDPGRDFRPCPGRITHWQPPEGEGLRLDTAVACNSVIPPYYDSMIAKLIVYGPTREAAVERLAAALECFQIGGVATNLPLLRFIARHPDFRHNRVATRWLESAVLPEFFPSVSSA